MKKKKNDFEIIRTKERFFVGMKITGPYSRMIELGIYWQLFFQRISHIKNIVHPEVAYGITKDNVDTFTYFAAIEVEKIEDVPKDMESLILPPQEYAVFSYQGNPSGVEQAIKNAREVLDSSNTQRLEKEFWMELYEDGKFIANSSNSIISFWIPINKKR